MKKIPYPTKKTPADHKIHEIIKKRWSPVAFSNQVIEEDKMNSLFEAMRWAPSSRNEQPWRIVYATKAKSNQEDFDRLASLLDQGNAYAKDAYLLLVICALKHHQYKNKPNRTHVYDTGAAAENIFLQAISMDLVAHEMGGFDIEKSYEVLNIPKAEVTVMAMMAIGYPGDENKLSNEFLEKQKTPRERKLISDFIFKGKWQ